MTAAVGLARGRRRLRTRRGSGRPRPARGRGERADIAVVELEVGEDVAVGPGWCRTTPAPSRGRRPSPWPGPPCDTRSAAARCGDPWRDPARALAVGQGPLDRGRAPRRALDVDPHLARLGQRDDRQIARVREVEVQWRVREPGLAVLAGLELDVVRRQAEMAGEHDPQCRAGDDPASVQRTSAPPADARDRSASTPGGRFAPATARGPPTRSPPSELVRVCCACRRRIPSSVSRSLQVQAACSSVCIVGCADSGPSGPSINTPSTGWARSGGGGEAADAEPDARVVLLDAPGSPPAGRRIAGPSRRVQGAGRGTR